MFFFPLMPKARAARKAAKKLYAQCVQRAREPVFYANLGVPDSFDGRFEMISLHAGLLINRLRNENPLLAQSIFDEMFLNMDMSCRQVGIGDLGVPKHMKRMMKALQGRAVTYEQAAEAGTLSEAMTKNLYATVEAPAASILAEMSEYILGSRAALKTQKLDDIAAGVVSFAALPKGDSHVENSKVA